MVKSATIIQADLRNRLIAGEYEGLEIKYLNWLMRNVPAQYRDRDELRQQIRVFILEAINRFNPRRKTKFTTCLFQHLRLRTTGLQQKLWIRSSGNKRCRMLPIGERRFAVRDNVENQAKFQEFQAAITADACNSLQRLLDFANHPKILKAFASKKFRSEVAKISGLKPSQIDQLRKEFRSRAPDFLEI